MDEAVWAPIIVDRDYLAARSEVQGVEVGRDGAFYLQDASVPE